MDGPERTVADPDVFYQDVFTAVELDELRAQVVFALGHLPLFDRGIGGGVVVKFFQRFEMRGRALHPLLPSAHVRLKRAFTGESHILALERVNERRVVEALEALPTRLHCGQVVFGIAAEGESGVLFEVQVHVALEMDFPGLPFAFGNHHAPAACVVAGGDGLADGFGNVTGVAMVVLGDVEILVGEHRHPDCRHGKRRFHGNLLMSDGV